MMEFRLLPPFRRRFSIVVMRRPPSVGTLVCSHESIVGRSLHSYAPARVRALSVGKMRLWASAVSKRRAKVASICGPIVIRHSWLLLKDAGAKPAEPVASALNGTSLEGRWGSWRCSADCQSRSLIECKAARVYDKGDRSSNFHAHRANSFDIA